MDWSVSRERRNLVSAHVSSHLNWPITNPEECNSQLPHGGSLRSAKSVLQTADGCLNSVGMVTSNFRD